MIAHVSPIVHAAPAYHASAAVKIAAAYIEPAYPDEVSPYTFTYAVADDDLNAAFNDDETSDGAGTVSGSYLNTTAHAPIVAQFYRWMIPMHLCRSPSCLLSLHSLHCYSFF